MRALIQRVSYARVDVSGECVGEIGPGLLVLLGVSAEDDEASALRLLDKILAYRVFSDEQGKMNLSVSDTKGGVLLVSQFTLVADTRKGLRPSFSSAAKPEQAQQLYDFMSTHLQARHPHCAFGRFAADMQVSLENDGPVTFLLET